jgi:hypothetical protein
MPLYKGGTTLLITLIPKLVVNLFGIINGDHYLCIDNVREMSGWGRDTSWSVDSNLPLYIIKGLTIIVGVNYCPPHILFLSLFYYEESTYTYVPSPLWCGDFTND